MSFTRIPLTSLLVLAALLFPGCSESKLTPEELQKVNDKLNKTTMSIAVALKSMWTTEEVYAQEQDTPRNVDLETWWISLTSTRLNLRRMQVLITEHPITIDRARNLWAGRIQENLNRIDEAGLLTTMPGPVTSKLKSKFGAERVEKETAEVLKLSREIEGTLGLRKIPVVN